MEVNRNAGMPAPKEILVNIPRLVTAYYSGIPDPDAPGQCVSFGTSGHRGSSFRNSFNEQHILAITQAICIYRKKEKITGPLFIGFDTHALSAPAFVTAVEVLAANGVEIMIAEKDEYTPTPVISHAILSYNRLRKLGVADGIVITPSHNPPDDGGFKYNGVNGGPADILITSQIEAKANELLKDGLKTVKRISYKNALALPTTHEYDYLKSYVDDLGSTINMDVISKSKIKIGVNPLGGAGVNYWEPIAEKYKLNLQVINKTVDPAFSFMTVDWDGKIRMDPSSQYAMKSLIEMKDNFDISFACDTDHDRHGIVTKSQGLMNPNNYLATAIEYLIQNRPQWQSNVMIGKTVVTTGLIDKIAGKDNKQVFETPVGFKWFVDGLVNSSLCFGGEESAGASFLRIDGGTWTTDKDGIIAALLAAEMTAKTNEDPGVLFKKLTEEYGTPYFDRVDANATEGQRQKLKKLSAKQIDTKEIGGEPIKNVLTEAPGNNEPIGGAKIITESGWFAARPSGTEDTYKIYAESFKSEGHLRQILEEAQHIVNNAIEAK